MATATARTPDHPAKPDSESRNLTRREFLNYVLGASVGLVALEAAGASAWFAMPRLVWGKDLFRFDPKSILLPNTSPVGFAEGNFWLCNTNSGLLALYGLCTRGDEEYKWVEVDNRFECPGCGSQFEADGTKIVGHGPAPRDLDRFPISVEFGNNLLRTTSMDGYPVSLEGASDIVVNVQQAIKGLPQGHRKVY